MSEKNVVARPEAEAALLPPVDVVEDSGGITLYADFPGVPRERLEIRVESDNLIIEGELAIRMPDGMEVGHAEVGLPRYRRVFSLSKELAGDRISAEYRQGVLKLRIPRAEHALPRRIEIQTA